jgi:amino acid adenylation domain-containing protein
LNDETRAPFDLERGPLVKARLIRIGKTEHVLLVVCHQIVCDGWSMNLLLHEIAVLYRSFAAGALPRLPELGMQYRDYAARQKSKPATSALEQHLAYWRERLQNSPCGAALVTDRPRPAKQSFRGARLPLTIPQQVARRLEKVGRDRRATQFMTLMAAFNVLLWRYSGQDDLSVGFPVAGRNRWDCENLVGCFVNTLVLRADLSGNPSFIGLLDRVREHCHGALAHQDLPFDRLVDALQEERDLSRNPLYQVMFAYQNYPAAEFTMPGLDVETLEPQGATAKFDLTLSLAEDKSSLRGFIEYASDLFDRSTIARMARHFLKLLRGIAANPNEAIASLPLLAEGERKKIVVEWNNTSRRYRRRLCIHHLFEAQAKRVPRSIAVECGGRVLTYAELDGRANQLARFLQKRGIGPEKLVAVCLDRSIEVVIALLAIFKSGAAYLPLDPKYPRARLAFMLEDARVSALITRSRLFNRWPPASRRSSKRNFEMIRLDREGKKIAEESSRKVASSVRARNLAYVIYTSGSTGRPKGVAIEHQNAVALLQWSKQVFSNSELAGVLASTSICFDLSIFELFAPLSTGGKIVLVEDALAIADALGRDDITLINTVPSAMQELLGAGGLPGSVRTVNLAGEPLKPELVQRLYQTGTVKKVCDLYGPSETTTYSTFTLRTADARGSIGRPIANSRIYLLDAAFQPVPIGVPGEIFVGGAGVARGYLRRPESSAERFLPDPFAERSGARMYRTGDFGRYYRDGSLEYLGRADRQIKLRGYRIELGEIEAALTAHPAIRESVVVVRAEAELSGNPKSKIENPKLIKKLTAYFAANDGTRPQAIELRKFLRERLPEFMVPKMFVRLEALPRTPNGKVDHLALERLEPGHDPITDGLVAPRSEIEEMVAQIWREVLNADRVGVFDDFFEIGGHSILATRVAARLRAAVHADLPLRKLFEARTVAGLAQEIEALRRDRNGVALPKMLPAPHRFRAPLSFAQRRLWFLHKLDPDLTAYNMPATYRISGPLKIALFKRALEQVIERHEILRSAIVETDGEPAQQVQPEARLDAPVIDLTALTAAQVEEEIARHANEDAGRPFDLAAAPLLRAKILRIGAEDHVVALNFHHIVCDGSSLALFFRELAVIYESLAQGIEPALAKPALQYADFTAWQRRCDEHGLFQAQTEYWKRQLGGAAFSLDLPTDRAPSGAPSYRGGKLTQRLSSELTSALKRLARKEQVTLFMLLLAALKILFSRLSGRNDIIVGSTIAGRNHPELEGLIGFFINALALRADLSGNPPFSDFLARVREVCLDAYTHQDVPFERVVEEINPQRDPRRNPIFQVLFNMAEIPERDLSLPVCRVTRLDRRAPEAKFDLVAHAPQVGDVIELALVYNTALFDETRVRAMLDQWTHLLSQIVDQPAWRLDQFSLVQPAANAILPDPVEALDDRWHGSIQSWIARQAAIRPKKNAVSDEREHWSYRELEQLSNRLACHFIAGGIRPKDVVAIYAHRDASIAVALLGVLKAGAVFLILDPAYPPSRLIEYLRMARPRGWVRMEGAGAAPTEIESCLYEAGVLMRLNLPRTKNKVARLPARSAGAAPAIHVTADDPAYIAFTSGSTGGPKGVLCRHGPVTHFLPWQEEAFNLGASDRYALLSGLGYNHLHRDVFTALAMGASLHVPAEQDLQDAERLSAWLRRQEISVLHLTPALGGLLQTAAKTFLPSARRIFFGGDVLSHSDVAAMREMAPGATLTSFYGATETQRAVGYFIIPEPAPDACDRARRIPIGRGAPGVQLLLLTSGGRLAGIGEIGELYVRSPHLAAGYVGAGELGEQNFPTNPFTGDPRDRLYRTRELGRYLPDGNVEWLGRSERRASVRGFRVELAEVERAVSQCPGVRHAAVVAHGDPRDEANEEQHLDAYVEWERNGAFDSGTLRELLKRRLPLYMIPSRYIQIARMPLNPSGKIDYAALTQVEHFQAEAAPASEAPANDLERTVAEIFAGVLQVERMGRRENFFAVGGHSLSAAKAAARIRETLGLRLDLRTFLQHPTVEGICRRLEEKEREEVEL